MRTAENIGLSLFVRGDMIGLRRVLVQPDAPWQITDTDSHTQINTNGEARSKALAYTARRPLPNRWGGGA